MRILRHGDLQDAACLVAPRRLLIGGCTEPGAFSNARRRFALLDAAGAVSISAERLTAERAGSWLAVR